MEEPHFPILFFTVTTHRSAAGICGQGLIEVWTDLLKMLLLQPVAKSAEGFWIEGGRDG